MNGCLRRVIRIFPQNSFFHGHNLAQRTKAIRLRDGSSRSKQPRSRSGVVRKKTRAQRVFGTSMTDSSSRQIVRHCISASTDRFARERRIPWHHSPSLLSSFAGIRVPQTRRSSSEHLKAKLPPDYWTTSLMLIASRRSSTGTPSSVSPPLASVKSRRRFPSLTVLPA